jgi:class 3 adenylate cyclase
MSGPGTTPAGDTGGIGALLDQRAEIERLVRDRYTRRLTVMFTDLSGSTALAEAQGDIASRALLKRYHDIVGSAVAAHAGTFIKTIGDGALAYFQHAFDGVQAATKIQAAMDEYNVESRNKTAVLVRIGLHTGDVILDGADIFGDTVNTASRFESSASPGEILISKASYDAIEDKSTVYCRYAREVSLKGKKETFQAYRVFWNPAEIERERSRPEASEAAASRKAPTARWKLALAVLVPLLAVAAVTWHFGMGGSSTLEKRAIHHSISPGAQK